LEQSAPWILPEYKIILIDDDDIYARLLRRMLEQSRTARFELSHVSTYEDATRAIQNSEFDAYLIDRTLGTEDGINLLNVGRRCGCKGAMIIVTGKGSAEGDHLALSLGATDYLEKDKVDGLILERAIRYAVHWKRTEEKLKQANRRLSDRQARLREAVKNLGSSHRLLQSTQLQLIHAEKMESVGRLAAGVAHEVKNPLAVISMGVDYLQATTPAKADKALPKVFEEMRDAVHRAARIISGLVDFSASGRLDLKVGDVNPLIGKSLLLVRHEMMKQRIKSRLELGKKLPRVRIDSTKLEQVFINVFMNAIQAMPEGGTLTVRTYTRKIGEADRIPRSILRRKNFRPGDTIVITEVDDTGTGIPPDALPKIFDPFFTTKPTGVGTGLGLSVVKNIIELHGGAIDIGNIRNAGVRVTIALKALGAITKGGRKSLRALRQ
jgi:signal transduction histidine kinase